MENIIKTVKSLEKSNLSKRNASEAIESKTNELKCGFLSRILGTLGARLLVNLSAGKSIIGAGEKNS